MPANKYALLRYRIIDRCLTNNMRPFPTKEDLRHACEEALYGSAGERISISTIEKDLWAMRNESELGYHAPIAYNAEHRGYHYEDPDYSISGLNLQDQDLQALRFATLTLLQFRDMPVFEQYHAAIGRIFDRVHASGPGQLADQFIQFEQAPRTLGTEHISALMTGISERRVVRFKYRKFDAADTGETERAIEPYLLKEYRNRWYLIGKPEGADAVRTFALDRMHSVAIDNARFVRDDRFDADRYFKHSLGITSGSGGVTTFQWAAAPVLSHYLNSQPLHGSQRILDVPAPFPGWTTYAMDVHPTYELNQLMLGFGADVRPLSPASWVAEMEAIHRKALDALSHQNQTGTATK
ncbi:MAG: WYL domain-containing protein [Flavobacteriales bacterium]|nr:WYL domain-containing protein [Flavobacteriales bacterium]